MTGIGVKSSLPTQIGRLTDLRLLRLDFNALDGPLPSQLGRLSLLTALFADSNLLTSVPSEIARLSDLRSLLLNGNPINSFPPLTPLNKLTLCLIGGKGSCFNCTRIAPAAPVCSCIMAGMCQQQTPGATAANTPPATAVATAAAVTTPLKTAATLPIAASVEPTTIRVKNATDADDVRPWVVAVAVSGAVVVLLIVGVCVCWAWRRRSTRGARELDSTANEASDHGTQLVVAASMPLSTTRGDSEYSRMPSAPQLAVDSNRSKGPEYDVAPPLKGYDAAPPLQYDVVPNQYDQPPAELSSSESD